MADEKKAQQTSKLAAMIPQIMNALGGGDAKTAALLAQQRQVNEGQVKNNNMRSFMRAVTSPDTGEITEQSIMKYAEMFNVQPQDAMKVINDFAAFKKSQAPADRTVSAELPSGRVNTQTIGGNAEIPGGYMLGTITGSATKPPTSPAPKGFGSSAMGIFNKDTGQITQKAPVKTGGVGSYSPSPLKKLIDERQRLFDAGFPGDHPDVTAYNNKISGVDVDAESMTPDEVAFWGENYNLTGKFPTLGRGTAAAKARMGIAKMAARLALDADGDGVPDIEGKTPAEAALATVSKQADTKSIQGSLNFLDKQLSSMGSFVNNLGAQVDKVKELSKDLKTFDTRLFNVPLRVLRGKISGSPLQAKYDMYLTEIEGEIGKLATGATGSVAELSASAQEKWSKIHDKNLSVGDMLQLLEETKHAAELRVGSVRNQLSETRNRMKTRDYGEDKTPTPIAEIANMPPGSVFVGPDGKKYRKK